MRRPRLFLWTAILAFALVAGATGREAPESGPPIGSAFRRVPPAAGSRQTAEGPRARVTSIDTVGIKPSPAFVLVSPDVSDVGSDGASFRHGLLVRDADGHATRLVQ